MITATNGAEALAGQGGVNGDHYYKGFWVCQDAKTRVFEVWYNASVMPQFPNDHVFILPHADEYRRAYGVSIAQVVQCLNEPDLREGLAEDHYTAEKAFADHHVYVYYYLTLPLQAEKDEFFVIVDFVGFMPEENRQEESKPRRLLKRTPKSGVL